MNFYPFLEEWLLATRRSEQGLIAVLVVAAVAVALLAFYRQFVPDDLPKLRIVLLALFGVITVGLAVMG
jgi:hypothetical protein